MSDRQLAHLKDTYSVTGWPQSPVPNFMLIYIYIYNVNQPRPVLQSKPQKFAKI
jgi:hypothetical protein